MGFAIMAVGPLLLGFGLDLLLGDPAWLYHPVRLMGAMIAGLEKRLLRAVDSPAAQRRAGLVTTLLCVGAALLVTEGLLLLAARLGAWVWFALQTLICYQMLAVRDLAAHSSRVRKGLEAGDLPGAREALSMIVGRDTASLPEEGIVRGAVETVAENASDGVVAPLFYLALGGPAMGVAYKMINTMDSMVGHKNEKYLNFGRTPARLDDVAGLLPSRLGALCMIAASALCGLDAKGAARIWRRDRRNHPSPNSAQTESACAGALGLRLGGASVYGGVLVPKPAIGDDTRPPVADDIKRANRLMLVTALLALTLCGALRLLLLWGRAPTL